MDKPTDKRPTMIVLGVLALCFLIGLIAGCLFSLWGGEPADNAAHEILTGLAEGDVYTPNLWIALWSQFQYPVICFLLGLTLLGVFLIPAAVAARGFFLAFTVTSCVRVFGAWQGLAFSLSILGLPALLTLPCLLILATYGGVSSLSLLLNTLSRGKTPPFCPMLSKAAFIRLGICALAMTAAALLEAYICPILVNWAI